MSGIFHMLLGKGEKPLASYRSKASANYSAGTIVVNKPSGTVDGDLMIAVISLGGAGSSVTTLSGWTLAGSYTTTTDPALFVFYKTASSEGSNYTWVAVATAGTCLTVTYTGTSLAFSGISSFNHSATGPLSIPSMTINSPGVHIAVASIDASASNVWDTPSGFTERHDAGTGRNIALFDKIPAVVGSTGSLAISQTSGSNACTGVQFWLY